MAVGAQSGPDSARKATNVLLNEVLPAATRNLRVNIFEAAEVGLSRAVADKLVLLWREDNQAALESSNAYVEQHGLPLAKYRSL